MRNVRLAIKILVGTVGIIVFLGLAMIFFVRTALNETLYESLKSAASRSQTYRPGQRQSVPCRTFRGTERIARDYLKSENDVMYIYFVDSRGEVVAQTFDNHFAGLTQENRPVPGRELSTRRLESDQGRSSISPFRSSGVRPGPRTSAFPRLPSKKTSMKS